MELDITLTFHTLGGVSPNRHHFYQVSHILKDGSHIPAQSVYWWPRKLVIDGMEVGCGELRMVPATPDRSYQSMTFRAARAEYELVLAEVFHV